METKLRNINELKLHPNNPRIIKDDKYKKLIQSLKDFPEMLNIRPIVIDENDIVLGGNQRLKAAKDVGMKEIPTILVNLTEKQKSEFMIKDNSSYGEWDWNILQNEWDLDFLDSWAIDIPGFDINSDEMVESFSLSSDDKSLFGQMTFTVATQQKELIEEALSEIKKTDEYKYGETFENENSNGNALYIIIQQWKQTHN